MKNLKIMLFALLLTAIYSQESEAQTPIPYKDWVVQWAGVSDTLPPRFSFYRWTGYLTANESTHQLTFRDPASGLPSIGSSANLPISNATQTALNGKVNQAGARTSISLTTTGTGPATYNNTTGVLNVPTPATAKKQETYSGTTNASGVYTQTFPVAYSVAPNIQANIVGGANNQVVTMTVTTTGFTCTVVQRSAVTVLGLEVLLAGTTPVNAAKVDVLITEK